MINTPDSIAANYNSFGFYLGEGSKLGGGLPNMPNYNLEALSIYKADAGHNKIICIEDTMVKGVLLGLPPVPGVEYSWYPADSLNNPFSAQPFATPSQSTSYYVTLYDSTLTSSCNPRTDTVVIEVKNCSVGISEHSHPEIKIYPNPAHDYLIIEGVRQPAALQLFDLAGKIALQAELQPAANRIEIKHLASGVYIYKVAGAAVVGKLFIEK